MSVGIVFIVDDQIKDTLDASANKYNHQNDIPNSSPGTIIIVFTTKEKNSTVFSLLQYSFSFIVPNDCNKIFTKIQPPRYKYPLCASS